MEGVWTTKIVKEAGGGRGDLEMGKNKEKFS